MEQAGASRALHEYVSKSSVDNGSHDTYRERPYNHAEVSKRHDRKDGPQPVAATSGDVAVSIGWVRVEGGACHRDSESRRRSLES